MKEELTPSLLTFFPKIGEKELLPHSFPGGQDYHDTKAKDTIRKLKTNTNYEYRYKNLQQDTRKLNPKAY